MTRDEATAYAEMIRESMSPYCRRIAIAGSIRRQKTENIKDIEIVAIPAWEERPDPTDLFGERSLSTNRLHEWAIGPTCPLQWIKPVESEITPWLPKPEGRYWRAIFPIPDQSPLESPKVDVFLTTPDRCGATFMLRTGSAQFATGVLGHARRIGFEFREGGLWHGDQSLDVPEEEEVFRLLGLRYVAPEHRSGIEQVVRERRGKG